MFSFPVMLKCAWAGLNYSPSVFDLNELIATLNISQLQWKCLEVQMYCMQHKPLKPNVTTELQGICELNTPPEICKLHNLSVFFFSSSFSNRVFNK